MKRLHVNLGVDDLQASIQFYSELFGAQPTLLKDDYARWMLADPLVNFAISSRVSQKGVNHLGIQVDNETELAEIYQRLEQAGGKIRDEGETTCCYAKSTKRWVADPQGIDWETFQTHGDSVTYGHERAQEIVSP